LREQHRRFAPEFRPEDSHSLQCFAPTSQADAVLHWGNHVRELDNDGSLTFIGLWFLSCHPNLVDLFILVVPCCSLYVVSLYVAN
jgi:hypothetical protein